MRIRERFNPRAPCGARHSSTQLIQLPYEISTHAPLAGRDYDPSPLFWFYYISTHAPLAGRD